MKKNIVFVMLILIGIGISVDGAFAGDCPFSLRLSGQIVPNLSGDAGDGTNAPAYDDVFNSALGLNIEGDYQLSKRFSLLIGIGYEYSSGGAYNGISFDDHKIMPVSVGGKYRLPAKSTGWIPYLRADVGIARLNSVQISYMGSSMDYWDSSWEPMFDIGAGAEYQKGTYGFFLEIRARYLDSPSSAMGAYSNSQATWSLPISMGITIHF